MNRAPLSKARVALALTVAIAIDAVQLPFIFGILTGVFSVPAEATLAGLDLFATASLRLLLGFNWVVLPSFLFELIPVLDALPIWTAYVFYFVWNQRRNAGPPESEPIPAARKNVEIKLGQYIEKSPVAEGMLDTGLTPELEALMAQRQRRSCPTVPEIQPPQLPPEAIHSDPSPSSGSDEAIVLDDEPVEAVRSQPKAGISKEAIVISVLVVPALLFAAWLLQGLRRPEVSVTPSHAGDFSQLFLNVAERKVEDARTHFTSILQEMDQAVKPGPEPELYHPLDYLAWRERNAAWQSLNHMYHRNLAEAEQAKQEAELELLRLKQELGTLSSSSQVGSEVKSAWARYVVPPLHFLLAFSLLRFCARAIFRFLLLKDKIGPIRI